MEETRKELDVAIWAYVIMPEHVHVLLRPMRPDYKLPHILASLKRGVSQKAKTFLEQNGERRWLARLTVRYPSRTVFRFWLPGGGNDHNVFRDKTVPHIMRYIHENPVRRGLAKDPREWAWSIAGFWAGSSGVPIRMDQPDM